MPRTGALGAAPWLFAAKLLPGRDRTVRLLSRVSLVLDFSSRAQVRKLAPKCLRARVQPMHQVSSSGTDSSAASGGCLKDNAPAEVTWSWDTRTTHRVWCGQCVVGVEWKEEGEEVKGVWGEFGKGVSLGYLEQIW